MEDREIVAEVLAGKHSDFRRLVEKYQDLVFHACLNILHDREDAEDVAQEVFVEVYGSLRSFRGEAKLSTWIYRIALSKSLIFRARTTLKKRLSEFYREQL